MGIVNTKKTVNTPKPNQPVLDGQVVEESKDDNQKPRKAGKIPEDTSARIYSLEMKPLPGSENVLLTIKYYDCAHGLHTKGIALNGPVTAKQIAAFIANPEML